MLEDAPFIGDWHRSTKLGSGGFGVVWLWQHAKSKEKIAVKKCHVSLGPNVGKQKERWEREVDYMTNKIRHLNIVRGIKVKPEAFLSELEKSNPSGMPILIMEYCEGGDLRKQLNDNQNVSGMVESEVRNILRSLKSAVEYLHSLSITHRDIKPENVVIQITSDGRRIYKLTDLGYAKPIDMRSVEASLVGTMEYIAPELITTEKYSCSVDYWSLGIIGYEVSTGSRPFAPHLPLAQWMLRVRDKKSEHITIYEEDDGNFVYSNRIYDENHLSKRFSELLKDWLTIALEWNPKQRGCIFEQESSNSQDDAPKQVLKFFHLVDKILEKKILTIFALTNHKYLSMEVDENTTNDDLFAFLEREVNIPRHKCHVIIPIENITTEIDKIGKFTKPLELYVDGYFDKPMIFVNEIGGIGATAASERGSTAPINENSTDSQMAFDLPTSVRNVLINHEQRLKVHTLRKFAIDTLHFIRQENDRYKTCLEGWYNYALQLNHDIELCRQNVKQMHRLIYGVNGALELYDHTLKIAQNQQPDIKLHTNWREQHAKITQNIQLLVDACDKITVRYQSIHRRSRDAHVHEILDKRNSQDFYDIANAAKAFDAVRAQIMNKKFVDKPHFELFQCAYKCLKRRDLLLRNKSFIELQRNLNCIHMEFTEIKKALDKAIAPAEKYRNELIDANQKLHEHIWSKMTTDITKATTGQMASTSTTDLSAMLESTGLRAINHSSAACSSIPNGNGLTNGGFDFQIGNSAQPKIKDQFGNSILCFGEGNDTRLLIDDNENLRISISGLLEEIEGDFGSITKPSSNGSTDKSFTAKQ